MRVWLVATALAFALTGCEQGASGPDAASAPTSEVEAESPTVAPASKAPDNPVLAAPNTTAQEELAATLPLPGETPSAQSAANVPHVYMSLQPDEGAGPLSVVFAIDRSRDNTPQDDPAFRLTPEDGQCNPQELRRYAFPKEDRERPTFGPDDVQRGVAAQELPNFMAIAVTGEMMRRGLIVEPEESKPQNVCTRKFWELMMVQQSGGQG